MAERKVKYLISESESMIMEYLWKQEEGKTFGDITEYLNTTCQKDWKRQTINTFIKRLTEKGLLVSQNTVKKRVYYPAMNYTEYKQGKYQHQTGMLPVSFEKQTGNVIDHQIIQNGDHHPHHCFHLD